MENPEEEEMRLTAEYEDRLVCLIDILGFKSLVDLTVNPTEDILLGDDRPKDARGLCDLFVSILGLLQGHKDEHYDPGSQRYKDYSKHRDPIFNIPFFQIP